MELTSTPKRILLLISFGFVVAGCIVEGPTPKAISPAPRDLTSPDGISASLARLQIFWVGGHDDNGGGVLVNLDGRGLIRVHLPAYAVTGSVSSSGHLAIYATSLFPDGDIELMNLATNERRLLVRGKERFPGAALLYPSFTVDEQSVVFEVGGNNRIDLAIVDIGSGKVQFMDLRGGSNRWPKVSPDKTLILVACDDPPRASLSLCILDRTRLVRRYLVDDEVTVGGDFSLDGKSVVYTSVVGGVFGEGRLNRVSVESGRKTLLVTGLHVGAEVLGTTDSDVVFTCPNVETPACSSVCVVGVDGKEVRRLTYLGEHCIDVNAP